MKPQRQLPILLLLVPSHLANANMKRMGVGTGDQRQQHEYRREDASETPHISLAYLRFRIDYLLDCDRVGVLVVALLPVERRHPPLSFRLLRLLLSAYRI